jgi:hypothetical protein
MLNRPINTEYSHLLKSAGIDDYIATLVEKIPRSASGNHRWRNDRQKQRVF